MKIPVHQLRYYYIAIAIITVVVLYVLSIMRGVEKSGDINLWYLPAAYSTLNAINACVLIYAYIQIKKKEIQKHRSAMLVSVVLSGIFLIGYLIYHFTSVEIKYCKVDWTRSFYFIMLITHIVLAAISFPLILITLVLGLSEQFDKHRKIAKWVYPMWLYVAITGPLCYVMLLPCR